MRAREHRSQGSRCTLSTAGPANRSLDRTRVLNVQQHDGRTRSRTTPEFLGERSRAFDETATGKHDLFATEIYFTAGADYVVEDDALGSTTLESACFFRSASRRPPARSLLGVAVDNPQRSDSQFGSGRRDSRGP